MIVCRGEKHVLVSHQCHPCSASFPCADRLAAAVVTDNDSEGRVELDHVDLLVVKGADAPKGHLCQGCGEKAATERHPSPLPHCPRTPSWHHCEGAQLWSRCWLENKVLDAWGIRARRGQRCKTLDVDDGHAASMIASSTTQANKGRSKPGLDVSGDGRRRAIAVVLGLPRRAPTGNVSGSSRLFGGCAIQLRPLVRQQLSHSEGRIQGALDLHLQGDFGVRERTGDPHAEMTHSTVVENLRRIDAARCNVHQVTIHWRQWTRSWAS